ncbi:MAG: hypothetical protein ACM3JH_04280 [Acidithiobacillales bacterium]
MSIDSRLVARIIQDALDRTRGIHNPTMVRRVWRAFEDLYDRRNDPTNPAASEDENLAAADHYMFARYLVGSSTYSYEQTWTMNLAYEHTKWLAQLQARAGLPESLAEILMRSDPTRPTVRSSQEMIAWGAVGARHGETDRILAGGRRVYIDWPPAFFRLAQDFNEYIHD